MSVWRTIPGFPGYAVSDRGEVASPKKNLIRAGGADKKYFYLFRDGRQKKVTLEKIREAAKRGKIIPNPLAGDLTAEAAPIPGMEQFAINRSGRVFNRKTGRTYAWQCIREGSQSPRVRLGEKWLSVSKLLVMTFGPRAYIEAGVAAPRGSKDDLSSRKYSTPKPKRRCHDCKKPTDDYRCPECRRLWRLKNDVVLSDEGCDVETVNS